MAAELHAGRLPSWLPYQYAGVPPVWPRFSPFILLSCLTASPVILAWAQLAAALVAGVGAYLFFRRTLGVTFWAATIPAWCYPMTGFFIFWQGFPTGGAVYWFPWLLLAVDVAVSRPRALSVAALGLVSALVLVSGHIDVGGQTLLASGLFAIWRLGSRRFGAGSEPAFWRPLATVVLGWTLGFMLASPQVLPLLDYARTGARMERRAAGEEERPPGDWSSLPQLAQPDMNGAMRAGSLWRPGQSPGKLRRRLCRRDRDAGRCPPGLVQPAASVVQCAFRAAGGSRHQLVREPPRGRRDPSPARAQHDVPQPPRILDGAGGPGRGGDRPRRAASGTRSSARVVRASDRRAGGAPHRQCPSGGGPPRRPRQPDRRAGPARQAGRLDSRSGVGPST